MKVVEVSERSGIEIPISDLLHIGGELKIRSDLIGRGFVEVRQADRNLKLRINGIIGRLMVTDDLALDIKPKFSISNLNRLVYVSKVDLKNIFLSQRPYEKINTLDYLPVPLVQSFSREISSLIKNGIFRSYMREEGQSSPKPKINFIKSEQKYWSKLQLTKFHIENFSYSNDNLPNQILKLAALKALKIANSAIQLKEFVPVLSEALRQMVNISQKNTIELIKSISSIKNSLPSIRSDYVKSLDLAVEILKHSDFSLDTVLEGIDLESNLISLDEAFEHYIRNILREYISSDGCRISVLDGNKQKYQKPLFFDNKKYPTKPDLIIKNREKITMIGDVKYKKKPEEVDRYQIIAHSLSFGVNKSVLVYPRQNDHSKNGLLRLGATGIGEQKIDIYEYYYDLSGNMMQEEEKFQKELFNLSTKL